MLFRSVKAGRNFRFGPSIKSYNHLKGWQAVCRKGKNDNQMLVVLHTFEQCEECVTIELPDESINSWKLTKVFGREGIQVKAQENKLCVQGLEEYDGMVALITC